MKKIVLLFGLMSIILITAVSVSAAITGEVLSTDITAFIDEQPIESFNINDYTYVIAEDLRAYGFDVIWDGEARTLSVERNKSADRGFLPMEKVNIKKSDIPFRAHMFDVYETDIVTFIGGSPANAYNVDGQTLIMIDELSKYGYFNYNNTERCVKIDMAGFEEKYITDNPSKQTISLPCDKTEGNITYTGEVLNGIPNGSGVIHERYEFTNGMTSTENYYYSGCYKNGEKDGFIYYHGRKIPHNGSDQRVRDYYSIQKYTNGQPDGYQLKIGYYDRDAFAQYPNADTPLAYREESKGAWKRNNIPDSSYRYGYRIESEGWTDSWGAVIDYEKTDAGKITFASANQDASFVISENGDLYGFGYFCSPYEQSEKDVPVKLDESVDSIFAGYGGYGTTLADKNGNLFYLWDKIHKYKNNDVPTIFQDVKKASDSFFLTNNGKLYKKPAEYEWTMYDTPTLIAENVQDFSGELGGRLLFMKNDGSVYFVRFNSESGKWSDGLDLSEPFKVFDNAKGIACRGRKLVIDENNILWGWSSDVYHSEYENTETFFTTVKPIQIAEDVTAADSVSSFFAYTKSDNALYVCPDYTEPDNETIFGITKETKILDDVKQFSAGNNFLLAVKNDGTLWIWGKNANKGHMGLGALNQTDTPVQIKDFYKFKE